MKLAAEARERLAKRWKWIAEQPVASFLRELPKHVPNGEPNADRGELVGVQTDLDGVWSNGKGTADNWKDWIVRKQDGYRVGRLHMLFEAAQGYRKVDDAASARRVLQAGLSGHEIYDADLKTLIAKYWPVTDEESKTSLGPAAIAWTLANYLGELSSAQQNLGEIDAAIITHSRLMLAHCMLSWSQPSDGPNKHARELWSLIRQRPEPLPPLFWFNLVDENNAKHKFDLSTAGQKGKPLTYHYYNMAAAPSLDFAELTITARTRGRKGILDCYRINAAGKHETIILLQPSADGEPDQTPTKTLKVPAGTGLVQFMVAGEDFQVGEVTVEAKCAKRAAENHEPHRESSAPPPARSETNANPSEGPVASTESSPVSDRVSAKLEALFQKHYPKATFVNRGVNGIHVEHEVTTFEFPSTSGKGAKREAQKQQGPKKGGVLCSVYSYPGRYRGQLSLSPAKEGQVAQHLIDRKEYKQLLMAPYSQKSDVHMWVAISYPADADGAFLEKFREIMADFEQSAE